MRRSFAVVLVLAAVLVPGRAGAPPPLPSFPATVRPLSGSAPSNGRVWIFGTEAPPLEQLQVALTIDGAAVAFDLEQIGCCAVVATPRTPRTGTATVVVTGPLATVSASWVVDAARDETPPTLQTPQLLDDLGGRLVVGVNGDDDLGLAGFLSRIDGVVQASAPTGYLLDTPPGSDGCVQVSAVDLAGQESAPVEVCGARPDAGVLEDAGAPDAGAPADAEGCSCQSTDAGPGRSPGWLLPILAGAWRWRRPRRPRPRQPARREAVLGGPIDGTGRGE